jgi:DNA-binding transcriptional LysR family regulator
MNLASIDLNLLVALDALIAESHVGRAARRLGLSQPATTHALNRLRDLLGDPLLVRVGGRMELTPRANGMRAPLAEALQRVQTLLAADSFVPATSVRHFALMMQDHIAHLVVSPLVRRLHAEAPGVRLNVLPWQSPASMRPELLRGIDLIISCIDTIPGLERQTLFTDIEVTVVRRGHPAAARLTRLDTFLDVQHIAVAGRGLTEDPVDAWLRQKDLARRIGLRVPSYVQALQAVAESDLVAFVPRRLAESLANPLALTLVRPPASLGTESYPEHLFHPRHTTHDPAAIWLRTLVTISVQKSFKVGINR